MLSRQSATENRRLGARHQRLTRETGVIRRAPQIEVRHESKDEASDRDNRRHPESAVGGKQTAPVAC